MTGWTFRCTWPVEDEDLGYKTAVALAEADLPDRAAEIGAKVVGPVDWRMVEHDDPGEWPHTPLALQASAAALPARPTREQLPAVIGWYAEHGFNDREIGRELGIPRDSVIYVRKKHGIPPGVPPTARVRAA